MFVSPSSSISASVAPESYDAPEAPATSAPVEADALAVDIAPESYDEAPAAPVDTSYGAPEPIIDTDYELAAVDLRSEDDELPSYESPEPSIIEAPDASGSSESAPDSYESPDTEAPATESIIAPESLRSFIIIKIE